MEHSHRTRMGTVAAFLMMGIASQFSPSQAGNCHSCAFWEDVLCDGRSTYVVLYEGNGCDKEQDCRKTCYGYDSFENAWNDEARSLCFVGPAGAAVTVYNKRDQALTGPYASIIKTDAEPVCVSTFELGTSGEWYDRRGYKIWYSGGDELDGSVSSIRFGRWW